MIIIYSCKICGKKFNKPESLGGHISIHYGAHSNKFNQQKLNIHKSKCLNCNKILKYNNHKFCSIECRKEYTKLLNENKLAIINDDIINLTQKQVKELKNKTNNCEICGKLLTSNHDKCLDHDHNLKVARGVLCVSCNRSLSWYENNKNKILKYLNK